MIRIETARLVIREPEITDLADWHRLMSDPKTMYYLRDIMTHSLEESKENLLAAISASQNPNRTHYFLAMELKETGVFMGSIGYTVTAISPVGKTVDAGYFILPEYHGKGYVTEALTELLRFAFEKNNVQRFKTGCLAENIPSERVMRKCGLVREGYLKAYEWHDGRYKDRVTYRLLKSEWETQHPSDTEDFWMALEQIVSESHIVIDRPRGSIHPKYKNIVYPVDYGYLENTTSMDADGIDVWHGSLGDSINAIICTVDLLKRDSEIKILIGCSEEEKQLVMNFHNESEYMKGIMLNREN